MLEIEGLSEREREEGVGEADAEEDVVIDTDALNQDEMEKLARRKAAEMIYGSADEVAGPVGGAGWDFDREETYRVTKLTPGVKDPNRVNVFLDGHFVLSLEINQVIDLGLKVDQEITKERLAELRRASEFGKLYQRSLEWVLTRPHSVREARDYLKRRQLKRKQLNRQRAREEKKPLAEFDDDLLDAVLKRLVEKKYLDDAKFAAFYVENRYVRKGISHKRLRMELRRKGIEPEMITKTFEAVPRDEDEEIMKMIAKKRKKYNDFQLVGYLVRQGFNFYNAKTAVEKYNQQEGLDDDSI